MGIKIIGTGSFTPEKVLTNDDLSKIVDTNDEWISTRTGIKERRIAEDLVTSDMSSEACKRALENANIAPEEIDLIIVGTATPDKAFPSTACITQNSINATNAVCFDVSAACSGFIYALEIAEGMMLAKKQYKKALVVGAEKFSHIVNWKDRNTCVLFGDGAGAVVLEKSESDSGIMHSKLGSNGKFEKILQVPGGGTAIPITKENYDECHQYVTMEGQEVFKQAVNSMSNCCKEVLEEAGVTPDEIRWLIPHQANYRILKSVAAKLKIAEENVFMNLDKYGNTSAASIGIAMDEMNRSGMVKPGDYILITAFGGGLTWGATLIKW
jgi:3-oxoacyl-[acyl-carrier-protein] synthase-3